MRHTNDPVCKICGFTERFCDCQDPDFESYPGEMKEEEEIAKRNRDQSLADIILNGEDGTIKSDNS